MSITKSYNRRTNTWYAYETNYVWDEQRQKKIQKRKCIGKFDPELNEIVANGPRGRPQLTPDEIAKNITPSIPSKFSNASLSSLLVRLETIEKLSMSLHAEATAIKDEIKKLMQASSSEQEEK